MSIATPVFSSLLLVCLSSGVLAQAAAGDCVSERDDALRLACYDKAAGRVAPAATATSTATAPLTEAAATPAPSVLDQRLASTNPASVQDKWFSLTAHRTNYVLPLSYNARANFDRYADFGDIDQAKDVEIKYQLSLKSPLWTEIADSTISLWMAFTLQSWWQAYSSQISAPFRETNYEPEIFAALPVKASLLGLNVREVALGLSHQSNGRTDPLSRSWNRVTSRVLFDNGNLAGYVKLWARIPEGAADDDNPNIERYMGQAEVAMAYRLNKHTFAGILKNNLRAENKSGLQLDWTYPISRTLKGYVQGYTGYGENLIDGDRYVNRISVGLMLADWF